MTNKYCLKELSFPIFSFLDIRSYYMGFDGLKFALWTRLALYTSDRSTFCHLVAHLLQRCATIYCLIFLKRKNLLVVYVCIAVLCANFLIYGIMFTMLKECKNIFTMKKWYINRIYSF